MEPCSMSSFVSGFLHSRQDFEMNIGPDDEQKWREINHPKVTQLVSDGFEPRFIWFQSSNHFQYTNKQ